MLKALCVIFAVIYICLFAVMGCQSQPSNNRSAGSSNLNTDKNKQQTVQATPPESAPAPPSNWKTILNYMIGLYGIKYLLDEDNIIITIDQNTALSETPNLLKAGFYKSWVTQSWLDERPVQTTTWLMLDNLYFIVFGIMSNEDIDDLNITTYITTPDKYGNLKKNLLFTCQIDRKLFNKINWKNFNSNNIPKVFSNFQMSNWANMRAYKENNYLD